MDSDRPSEGWEFRLVGGRIPGRRAVDHRRSSAPSLTDILAPYLSSLRANRRPETIRSAQGAIARLIRGLDLRELSDVTKGRMAEWRLGRITAGASNRTANHEVSILSAALNYAAKQGLIDVNPLAGLEALPTSARHRRRFARALTDEEIARLLAAAVQVDRKCTRWEFPREPLLRALLATGARWGEATSLQWADVDFDRRTVTFRGITTKNERSRRVALAPDTFASILQLREFHVRVRGELPARTARVFLTPAGKHWPTGTRNFHRYLDAARQLAGVERKDANGHVLHVHALRHTCATRWANQGMPLLELQRLLGHSDPKLTARVYIDASIDTARQWILPLPGLPPSESLPPDQRRS